MTTLSIQSPFSSSGAARLLPLLHLAPLLLLVVPWITQAGGTLDLISFVLVYGLFAMSLNLLVGYTGLVSFGHAMFFAFSAYGFCLLLQAGWALIPAMLGAIAASTLLACFVGAVCVRLHETYFSFITLAMAMLLYNMIEIWAPLTGGDQGLTGMIRQATLFGTPVSTGLPRYHFITGVFCVSAFAMYALIRSSFGTTLRMVRDNESRCAYLGVNVYVTKLAVFILAGLFASVAGVLATLLVSGAYPTMAFWPTSGDAIFAILLGGSRVFYGPLAGALLLRLLVDGTTRYTGNTSLVLGVLILAIVLLVRKGPVDKLNDWWQQRKGRPMAPGTAVTTSPLAEPPKEARPC
ncbi:branched-chain amino acid ABC transporter permease [Ottowia thiooxydans]|uniref:branched-chain amino acid ABC transporter permease n=1 Tax=Ottowia thiooxydans TaxID=219182 RepID=UPI0004073864|nr:branched-chain amino acid ABC transporter permease [Ottowia thiooxydans]